MEKLESERAGQIIAQLNGYGAFIPHKLCPSGPKLDYDLKFINLISGASLALGELKSLADQIPDPDLFVSFYVRKEALLSAQIEGTQCSLDEVIQVDEKTYETKPVHEVVNYIAAMSYGLKELTNLPMSIRLIHQIHEKILDNARGKDKTPDEFKRTQNWIGPPGCLLREAVFVPPPPEKMLELMGDLESYYHAEDDTNILVKAAILHAHFETIHPYLDGNGRLGRLLITFMLCEKKVLSRPLLYLSLFFKENKPQYYDLLMKIRTKGLWEDWIKFFLRGVRNTSNEAVRTAREILALQKTHREQVARALAQHKHSNACYDIICRKPIISIPEIVRNLEITYPTAKQIIDGLNVLGILSPYGERERNRQFAYKPYLEILRRGTELH